MIDSIRSKYLLSIYGGTIGTVIIIAGLIIAGAGGYVFLNPPVEETPPQEFDVQTFSLDVTHDAKVTGNATLHQQGEILTDYPVYYIDESPNLRLVTTVNVPESKEVAITQRMLLRHEATFNGEVFWEQEELIMAVDKTVDDGRLRTNTSISVPRIQDQIAAANAKVGSVGSVSSELVIKADYESPAEGGETYTGQLVTTPTPQQATSNAYYVSGTTTDSDRKSQTKPGETQVQQPNMTRVGVLIGVGISLIFAGVGLLSWNSQKTEIEELEDAVTREQYSEWISDGEFPTDLDKQHIYIDSLKNLVDIAIDTNSRIIYDSSIDGYSIVTDDVVYYYAADPASFSTWIGSESLDEERV